MKQMPGAVRDSIFRALSARPKGAAVKDIVEAVNDTLGPTPASSIRSYLNLNTGRYFVRSDRGVYRLHEDLFDPSNINLFEKRGNRSNADAEIFRYGSTTLVRSDCFDWLRAREASSLHAKI